MMSRFAIARFNGASSRVFKTASRCASTEALTYSKYPFLKELGLEEDNLGVYNGEWFGNGPVFTSVNPTTNEPIARVRGGTAADYDKVVEAMDAAKTRWASMPAPERGEVVRKVGEALRENQENLGRLVSLEMGKIFVEGVGEVQEGVDICDFAVGLSRMLNGSVIPSERPDHFMMERWNPLIGHVGIISAFNFPVAVYLWNLSLSLVCGNCNVWKPHEGLGLTTVATTKLVTRVLEENGYDGAVASLICGTGAEVGTRLVADPKMELVSFTGSTAVGRGVNEVVAGRFGKRILELGGNNALIVDKHADLSMALRATLFGAVGTAGQRCTSTRRLLVHTDVYDDFVARLVRAYEGVVVGDPLEEGTLCGPVFNQQSVSAFAAGVAAVEGQGGRILCGGRVLSERGGNFVEPTVAEVPADAACLQTELFSPLLYVVRVSSLEEAIKINNSVPQGLSAALFTNDLASQYLWTGPNGSDTGICNVNIGTSGAEIGGAFGGEKETGAGGRESGSDAWKQYMRRSTCTVNHGKSLPLAQGISFGDEE